MAFKCKQTVNLFLKYKRDIHKVCRHFSGPFWLPRPLFWNFSLLPFSVAHSGVCVTIEFSSRGVQTMFLAYIGGLF